MGKLALGIAFAAHGSVRKARHGPHPQAGRLPRLMVVVRRSVIGKSDTIAQTGRRPTAHGLAAAMLALVCLIIPTRLNSNFESTRTLTFYNIHNKETTTVTYKRDGRYIPDAIEKLSWAMRDWRRNEPTNIDPKLLDLVWELYTELGSDAPIHLISAYRSPKTNASLRARGGGQAKNSQHMLGKAADIHFPDVPAKRLRNSALIRERGGVGYYPTSAIPFVHVDTARVRHWPKIPRMELAALFPDGRSRHVPSDGRPITKRDHDIAMARLSDPERREVQLALGQIKPERQPTEPQPADQPRVVVAALDQQPATVAAPPARRADPPIDSAKLSFAAIGQIPGLKPAPPPIQLASLNPGFVTRQEAARRPLDVPDRSPAAPPPAERVQPRAKLSPDQPLLGPAEVQPAAPAQAAPVEQAKPIEQPKPTEVEKPIAQPKPVEVPRQNTIAGLTPPALTVAKPPVALAALPQDKPALVEDAPPRVVASLEDQPAGQEQPDGAPADPVAALIDRTAVPAEAEDRTQVAALAPDALGQADEAEPATQTYAGHGGAGAYDGALEDPAATLDLAAAPERTELASLAPDEENTDGFGDTGWVTAPEYDEDHPDELFYRPFKVLPFMVETAMAADTEAMPLSHPDNRATLAFMADPEHLVPLEFRPQLHYAVLLWSQQFSGKAVYDARRGVDLPGQARAVRTSNLGPDQW